MTERVQELRQELIKVSQAWASGADIDAGQAAAWREETLLLNHRHYLREIPVYRKLAAEAGCGDDADIAAIKRNLMFSADIFKSYDQSWLDAGDYAGMTGWLSASTTGASGPIYRGEDHRRLISRLGEDDVHASTAQGLRTFSFVPRDAGDWELSREG
jgi:hypothetical protein